MKKYRLKQNMTCDQEIILSDDESLPAEFFEEIKKECKHEKSTRIGDTRRAGAYIRCEICGFEKIERPKDEPTLKPSEWIEERVRYYKKNGYATPFESALLNFLDDYFKY